MTEIEMAYAHQRACWDISGRGDAWTPAEWERLSEDVRERILGTIRILRPALLRVDPRHANSLRIAHLLHAAYTVYCIRHDGLQRAECRAWVTERPLQRRAFRRAGLRLCWLLYGARKAATA